MTEIFIKGRRVYKNEHGSRTGFECRAVLGGPAHPDMLSLTRIMGNKPLIDLPNARTHLEGKYPDYAGLAKRIEESDINYLAVFIYDTSGRIAPKP